MNNVKQFKKSFNPKWTGYHGVRQRPGEVKLGFTFWQIARDWWGLNWKIPIHEEGSVYDVSPCYRGCWSWELRKVHLERVRGQAQRRTHRLRTRPSMAQDQKLIGILTGAMQDCGPQPGGTSPTLGWSVIAAKSSGRGVSRVAPWPDFWRKYVKMYVKTSSLRSCHKFGKIQKTFLQEWVFNHIPGQVSHKWLTTFQLP